MMASSKPVHVLNIVGARPNFMKIAPLMREFNSRPEQFKATLVHTGQHYDEAMKASFFRQLGIPEPDVDLEVGSGSHAVQTAEIMKRFEPVLDEQVPDVVLVVGDVNSTIACALVAVKKGVPVIHVEAGLRSFDREMPEEINRILTDQLSEMLFTTEPDGQVNLVKEGIPEERIRFVGNVMIDTLFANREQATPARETLATIPALDVDDRGYGVLTLHRPSNVDDPVVLKRLLTTLSELSESLPLVFPVHPRTAKCIRDAGLQTIIDAAAIHEIPPLGYQQLLGLMAEARLMLTDSGGIQEETTALGVPCITLRENTERPVTVTHGTNTIVGTDPDKIRAAFRDVLETGGKAGNVPELWDGQAASRIADAILHWWSERNG